MPWDEVFGKFKKGTLHSGSKKGPIVKSKDQAVAIAMSEKRKADSGEKPEYKSKKKKSNKAAEGLKNAGPKKY